MNDKELRKTVLDELDRLKQDIPGIASVTGTDEEAYIMLEDTDGLFLSVRYRSWLPVIRSGGPGLFPQKLAEYIRKGSDILRQLVFVSRADCPESVKDRLIVRPVNKAAYSDRLSAGICREFGDIALVLYCEIMTDGSEYVCFMVPAVLAETWQADPQELLEYALKNTMDKYPPRIIIHPTEMLDIETGGTDLMAYNTTIASPYLIPMITTGGTSVNGAIAMFYPGVLKKISLIMNGSYYFSFTAVSEARIHDPAVYDCRTLLEALDHCNRQFPSTLLSRCVYEYDAETDTVSVAAQS